MRAKTKTVASPVGGWNARDAIANMPEADAVKMDDAFPNTTDVQLRKGVTDHVTGITGENVETLAAYNNNTKSELFASTNDSIFDVTSAGAVGSADVSSGITVGKWQHINFKVPTAAHWLMMVNGTDAPHFYDGTTWTAITGVSTPAITGVTPTSIIGINEFKHRVWLIEDASSSAWYLPTDAVGGAATEFDVGTVFNQGGYLVAMATWSLDAGSGLDDYAVFISSKGQVAVYQGTDPASASTFALVGVFEIGSPLGRRCFIKFGGDLLILTQGGLVPLSKALLNAEISQAVAVTDKIRDAVIRSITLYGANFGWQLLQYPNANMLILNVPTSSTTTWQYVMNTITGSWCRWTGIPALCWELFNDEIYYGTAATVVKGWTGTSDNGANITANVIPAFSYYGNFLQKRFTMARPIMSATGTPSLLMDMNVDFAVTDPVGTPTLSASNSSQWDVAQWDVGQWSGDFRIQSLWQGVSGIGFSGSLHVQITSNSDTVKWLSTEVLYEVGAVI